jgi:hypothetical protein
MTLVLGTDQSQCAGPMRTAAPCDGARAQAPPWIDADVSRVEEVDDGRRT